MRPTLMAKSNVLSIKDIGRSVHRTWLMKVWRQCDAFRGVTRPAIGAVLVAAVVVVAACSGGDGPPDVTLTSIVLSPTSATLQVGATQQFTATGHYSDGSTAAVAVDWTATGGSVSSSGLYTGGSVAGAYQVVATQQGGSISKAASVTLTAVPPVLDSITVSPSPISLAPAATQQFTATGHYTGGGTGSVAVNWSATGGTITAAGLYTAGASTGPFQVTATLIGGSMAGTAAVTITPAPPTLTSVTVAPTSITLAPAGTQQFAATGHYSDGSTNASIAVDWTATGGTVNATGLYTAGGTDGGYQVTATAQGTAIAGHGDVTITTPPPTLVGIEVSPTGYRIKPYDSTPYTAIGRLSDGGTAPVAVTWSTSVITSLYAENSISSAGMFKAGYPIGSYTVTATLAGGSLTGTATGTVHQTTGATVSGPLFWAPVAGKVYLCTSNHFTDDGNGLGGVATMTASEGLLAPTTRSYTNIGAPVMSGDGSGAVAVVCDQVWEAPVGLVGTVDVTISVASNRPGTGMAKVFVYGNFCLTSDCRANYTYQLPLPDPNWTTLPAQVTATVSATTGANIWFKNTYVP